MIGLRARQALWLSAASCALMLGVCGAAAAQASKAGRLAGPVIPFELDRLAEQGAGGKPLRLNDDSALIPGGRIAGMPIVNGKMGEYVDLYGVRVHIPFGNIVAASTEFASDSGARKVTALDQALGAVCAREAAADGKGEVQMRISRDRAVSLVKVQAVDAANQISNYKVATALEPRWLGDEPAATRLFSSCQSGGATKTARTTP
jgi:hypothetical protein